MTDTNNSEKVAATEAAAVETTAKPEVATTEPSHIQKELARIGKTERTEAEKAAYTLKKNAERARELGLDPKTVLGIDTAPEDDSEDDDNKPVTVGMLKKRDAEKAITTAIQLADAIEDEDERTLTKKYLEERIKPSGNPEEDLRFARAAVNSVKNGQIAEELARKGTARTHVSAAGAPGKTEAEFTPTAEELSFMGAPFNLTKDKILAARKKESDAQ